MTHERTTWLGPIRERLLEMPQHVHGRICWCGPLHNELPGADIAITYHREPEEAMTRAGWRQKEFRP